MKIAIYCTIGNKTGALSAPVYRFYPERAVEWDRVADKYPEHDFCIYCSLPGTHLIDAEGDRILTRANKVPYVIIPEGATVEETVDIIAKDSPDVAVAFSTPDLPFDWNSVKDALVGEELRKKGIHVIAHSVELTEGALEKQKTSRILKAHGFRSAKGIYVQNSLFFAHRDIPVIANNVYREYIYREISLLHFPVVIKPASGAGSIGVTIANDINEAKDVLVSEKNDTDMMVEEWLSGPNFGVEIYGTPGSYRVMPPILLSSFGNTVLNQLSSVKFGPIMDEKFRVNNLMEEMKRIAEELCFVGSAEVDLIFHEGEWYVVEINTRYSILSLSTAAMEDRSVFEVYGDVALGNTDEIVDASTLSLTADFKTVPIDDNIIKEMRENFPCIHSVTKVSFRVSEEMTVGYCEFVLGGFHDSEGLLDAIRRLKDSYGEYVTEDICANMEKFVRELED